jgi:hypothetical protein
MMNQVILLATFAAGAMACPGTNAIISAKCEMDVKFDQPCSVVKAEVEGRIAGANAWIDPKSKPGKYTLRNTTDTSTGFSRTTGDGQYTDLVTFAYSESTGCAVRACSQSQVTSVADYDTNYCNSYNLFSPVSGVVGSELTFTQAFRDCRNPGLPETQKADRSTSCFR